MKSIFVIFLTLLAIVYGRKGFGPGEQDWGYVEVRPGAHMFWWLYYTTADVTKYTERPLVLWIQGGPGGSGTGYGNFKEFGPLDTNLEPRNYTWVKDVNVMFIDNPVGTGFSYVNDNSLLVQNNAQIAKDLVAMIKQFYVEHPEFIPVAMYMTSESYGGKMVSEFALNLYKEIQKGTIQCNFKGISLGDSWISPIDSVVTWAPYLLNLGVIDRDGFTQIDKMAQKTKEAYDQGKYTKSTELWGETENAIDAITGGVDFYDIMKKIPAYSNGKIYKASPKILYHGVTDFADIMNTKVKKALGIPDNVVWVESNEAVFSYLTGDFMKPVINIVESVLNETTIKVFVLSGQKDLIVDTPGTIAWVERMNWNGKDLWSKSNRETLVANHIIEGYVKKTDKFAMIWVDRAGHMVPSDNPSAMTEILRIFTNNYSSN